MNPELWYEYTLEKIDSIENLIKSVPAVDGARERSDILENAEDQLEEIQGKDLRQFQLETRLLKDTTKRQKSTMDLRALQMKLQATKGLLASVKAGERRRELLKNGDEGDEALAEASLMQDDTQRAMTNMKRMIEESKQTGSSALGELRRQRKVIEKIDQEADKGSAKISRSEKLVKKFARGNFFRKLY